HRRRSLSTMTSPIFPAVAVWVGKSIAMDLLPKLPCPRIFASYVNFFGKILNAVVVSAFAKAPARPSSLSSTKRAKTGGKGIRTPDLLIANETLYQLSYTPKRSANYRGETIFRQAILKTH